MKRSCKHIDITNPETLLPWVTDCILRHKRRYDFRELMRKYGGYTREQIYRALETQDNELFKSAAKIIAADAARQIKERSLNLTPITYEARKDASSGKVRMIGSEGAMQQIFDYVAVYSCMEIWNRRIVPQQVAGIKGRGTLYGIRMVHRWIESDSRAIRWARKHEVRYTPKCKCHVKLDIKQCYPSMRADNFLKLFRRDCANSDILWLWERLLGSHAVCGYKGFMIGSLCSQWACQYCISFMYRYAMSLKSARRGKSVPLIRHMLIQMDDLLLLGSNRKYLIQAAKNIAVYAQANLGLTIKSGWQICRLKDTPIDIIGYKLYQNGSISIRARIFLRARRAALRGASCIERARRIVSYKGYFVYSDSRRTRRGLHIAAVWKQAQHIISTYTTGGKAHGQSILQLGA